jgi:ribosomal protein S6--L-glutamate ligase
MILSFHPLFEGDTNIVCAGRKPGPKDIAAMRAAAAVILPQGCRQELYEIAGKSCPLVFPNYDARFDYPDKIDQVLLFQKQNALFPRSVTFADTGAFNRYRRRLPEGLPLDFPFVFKFNWGGEGETVHLVPSAKQFEEILAMAGEFEQTGQRGFIIQAFIPSGGRTLRVTVIGQTVISYWRVQKDKNAFAASVAKGAEIDPESDPDRQDRAVATVKRFCRRTRINLAGFDFLYSTIPGDDDPYLLEINYFFGRRGLGGSEKYYAVLIKEIDDWLARHGQVLGSRPPDTKIQAGR